MFAWIVGYKSQNESFLAMERGENEGYSSTFWSSLKLTRPEWVTEKKVKMLLQYGVSTKTIKGGNGDAKRSEG